MEITGTRDCGFGGLRKNLANTAAPFKLAICLFKKLPRPLLRSKMSWICGATCNGHGNKHLNSLKCFFFALGIGTSYFSWKDIRVLPVFFHEAAQW